LAFGQPASPSSSVGPAPSPRPSRRPPTRSGLLLTARPPGPLPPSPTSRLTEAAATGWPSAAGWPFGCLAELLPLPVTNASPHRLSPLRLPTTPLVPSRPKRLAINAATTGRHHPAHELPPPPYKSHREHPRTAPPLLTPSFTSLLA
jgi:hypothetical protein